MKKTMKRFLTAALVMAMVLTMVMVPVSAANTAVTDFDLKKDFTLMDQDLSTIKNSMIVDGTWGKLSEQPTYADGTEWGSDWGIKENERIGFNGGFNTVAGTWEEGKESVFSRKIFARMPIKKLNDDLTFTYDITTGPQYPTQIYTIAFINSNEGGPQLFGYNANTLQLGFGGRGNYAFDFANETLVDLQPNTDYTVTVKLAYDKSAACYDLIGNVKGGTGGNAIDTTITVDNYDRALSSENFSAVGFRMANSDAISEETPVTVLNIKNMKVVENVRGHIINFADAKYYKHLTMIDTSLNSDISNAVATDNSEYISGSEWGTNLPENIGRAFTASEGTISACFVREESGKPRDVSKKFVPVTDGEVLKVSGDVKLWTPTSTDKDEWNSNTIELVGADDSRLILFGAKGNPYWREFFILHQGDFNGGWTHTVPQVDVTTNGETRPNSSNPWVKVSDNDTVFDDTYDVPNGGKNWSSMEGFVNFTVTAAPNASDDSKYDVTLTFVGDNIETTSVKTVDKAFVQKLDAIKIFTYSGWTSDAAATQVRNLKVEKYPNVMKDGFVKGTNTLYLPIENVTGHEATYAIIAAVCDKTSDEQKNFFIRQYPNNSNALDNLAIDVEISDPATEYVKFYVFNGYDSLVPYTTPIPLGK